MVLRRLAFGILQIAVRNCVFDISKSFLQILNENLPRHTIPLASAVNDDDADAQVLACGNAIDSSTELRVLLEK